MLAMVMGQNTDRKTFWGFRLRIVTSDKGPMLDPQLFKRHPRSPDL